MLINSSLTVYHKEFDKKDRVEIWHRYNYGDETPKVWFYGGRGASIDKGYQDANDVQIRIPYDLNPKLDVNNFKIGDILVKGCLDFDIKTQQDLRNYEVYNIQMIKNNIYGKNKHIHIGGK